MTVYNLHKLVVAGLITTTDPTSFVGHPGLLTVDNDGNISFHDGTTPGGSAISGGSSGLPVITVTYSDNSEGANNSVGTIGSSGISQWQPGGADVLYSVTSTTTVTETGTITWIQNPNSISDNMAIKTSGLAATGANGVRFNTNNNPQDFVVVVFATNSAGTAYSAPFTGTGRELCLAEGTLITLSNGETKTIENVTYEDVLKVWDFDYGIMAKAKPLWIMKESSKKSYNLLTFNDGSVLRTVGQHRIFNKEAESFTYPVTDSTPLGTTTFNQEGKEVVLVDKRVVMEQTKAYNIITSYHMNLFANGILTSTSLNNLYPMQNMKFVKDSRSQNNYDGVPDLYYYGLRLAEQIRDDSDIKTYVNRLITTAV